MTKANRIKLGLLWKEKLPRGISSNHPYILEAEEKSSTSKVFTGNKGVKKNDTKTN